MWSQYLNPELLAFAVYALHTGLLLFIMKSKSQKIWLLLSESAVTLNTPITLTECPVQILPESHLWRIKDISADTHHHVPSGIWEPHCESGSKDKLWIWLLGLESCSSHLILGSVCLSKLFNLSVPEFPLPKNWYTNSSYLIGVYVSVCACINEFKFKRVFQTATIPISRSWNQFNGLTRIKKKKKKE